MMGCQKQPTASFTTDKTTYTAGETVKCTNASTNGKSYLWTFSDGQTSTAQDVDYTISPNFGAGSITIKLKANSRTSKKTNEVTQIVNVVSAHGTVMFWNCSSCAGNLPISVTIGGSTQFITSAYSSLPNCGTAGCAMFTLDVGSYAFTATDGNITWNGTVTVTKGGCFRQELL